MKPQLSNPDDGSCGGASDVAVNGEQKVIVDENTFIIKSDNSSSSVSVYLFSEQKSASSKSASADEKGSPEAREIWRRLEAIMASKFGGVSEYVANELCHCCRKAKPAGVKFHCGKHTYCSSHFEKRLGFPAVHIQQRVNDIYCPVCILRCTCKTCNDKLMAVTQIMKSECVRQGCGPSEVQMDNLFELCTATPSKFASIAKLGKAVTPDASKSPAVTLKTSSTGSNHVIVSLKDSSYKQIMEECFKKLGPKSNHGSNQQIEVGKLTEIEAAGEVFDKLKARGDRFVRLTNPHNMNDGYDEIDDETALKKIRSDINRRMESAKRWLHPKSSAPKQSKRKIAGKHDKHATKRPCKKATGHETRHVVSPQTKKRSKSKCSVKGCPLEYVGNYIANHVKGWDAQQRTNRLGFDYYVIYQNGCDKKSAEEGKNKFTGYDTLAVWAFETGYYTKHVVETEEGMEILEKLGIESEPYSIFNKAANQSQSSGLQEWAGEPLHYHVQTPDSGTTRSESAREERQDIINSARREVACPQNFGPDSSFEAADEALQEQVQSPGNTPASSENAREEQQGNLAGSHTACAKRDESQSQSAEAKPVKAESPLAGFKRFSQTVIYLRSSLASAKDKRDELGIKFFGHLEKWLGHKSNDSTFVRKFRSDDIDDAVQVFRNLMEQNESSSEGTNTFNLADIFLDQVRENFALD